MTMRMMEFEYIYVVQQPVTPGRRTHRYEVANLSSSATLGIIAWHGAWRQYWFMPCPETGWSEGCVLDIAAALRKLNQDHKDELRKRRAERALKTGEAR